MSTPDPTTNVTTFPANCNFTGSSIGPPKNGGTVNMSGNTQISGGWDIKNETVNLAPGTYWISDGNLALDSNSTLECTTCVNGGAGVTIILTTAQTSGGTVGNITQQSNAVVDNLNAPGSGTFQNLLLIQDSNSLPSGTTFASTSGCTGSCSTFQGTPGQALNGVMYFPNTQLNFQGNPSTTNPCLILVANTLTLAGNAGFASSGCPNSGPGATHQVYTIALLE